MFKLLATALAATLLAGSAVAAESPSTGPTAADLAACRRALDQPICLLRLAARARNHKPYRDDIDVGYAPQVLAAVGPDAADDPGDSFVARLRQPEHAAVLALAAVLAGGRPADALVSVRELATTGQRIEAYQLLWRADHDQGFTRARVPGSAFDRAVLDAWRRDLAASGAGDTSALALSQAYRMMGDDKAADGVPQAKLDEVGRVSAMLDAGRVDDAARLAEAMGPMSDPLQRLKIAVARSMVRSKAVAAGRLDVALRLAEVEIDAWFSEIADPAHPGLAHSGASLSSNLVLVATFAPRPQALKLTERMDRAARDGSGFTAAASAVAAARAWTRLGEPSRAQALLDRWPRQSDAELKACAISMLARRSGECASLPAFALNTSLRDNPLDAPWDELVPVEGLEARMKRIAQRGVAGVDADLAAAASPAERILVLGRCAMLPAALKASRLAGVCVRRLAVEPLPEPQTTPPASTALEIVIEAAWQAAIGHDSQALHEMLAVVFDLAERTPTAPLERLHGLEVVAVAELREQGRL